jgi:uncharacterized membrane-anchored protein
MKMKLIWTGESNFGGLDTTISILHIEPDDFWRNRYEIHKQLVRSANILKSLTPDQRAALVSKVKKAMAIMHDEVEEWLPDALSMDKDGATLRVEFNMLAAEIDQEVSILEQLTSFDIEKTVRNTKQALAELKEVDDLNKQ